jgi:hypothetical protein
MNQSTGQIFEFNDEIESYGFIGDMIEWGMSIKQHYNTNKSFFVEINITKIKDKEDIQSIIDFANDHHGKRRML